MMNRNAGTFGVGVSAAAFCAIVVGLAGCGEDPPPPQAPVVQAQPPPPPPPPAPKVTPVADLMAELGIDKRINLPEDKAPDNDPARIALLEFFDAFVRGDDKSIAKMLSTVDKFQLEDLVKSGVWKNTTEKITRVDVQSGQSPFGEAVALALFTVSDTFQPQLWQYEASETDAAAFEAVATPPGIIDRLSGEDWIAAWYKLIDEEMLLAEQPEEDLTRVQRKFDEEGSGEASDAPTPTGPMAPGGGGQRRKPPPTTPIKPFRPGGGGR